MIVCWVLFSVCILKLDASLNIIIIMQLFLP